MGWQFPPYYGNDNFYAKKIEKINKQIKKLEEEKAICEQELLKNAKKD